MANSLNGLFLLLRTCVCPTFLFSCTSPNSSSSSLRATQAQDQRKIMADRNAAERGDFGPAGREAVAHGDFDARRESALASREVTRNQCAEVQDRRHKLLAEAAAKAPLFVHAAQVAAEAAAATKAQDAASRDGGAAAATASGAASVSEESEFAPPPASNSNDSSSHALPDPLMPPRPRDSGEGLPSAALHTLYELLSTSPNLAHHRLAAAVLNRYDDSDLDSGYSNGGGGVDSNEDGLTRAAKSDPLNLLFFVLPTDADDDPCVNLPIVATNTATLRSSMAGDIGAAGGASSEHVGRADRSLGVDGSGAGAGLLGLLSGSGERVERASEWSFSDAAAPQNKEAAEESEARAGGSSGNRFNLPKMPSLGQIFESGPFLGPSSSSSSTSASSGSGSSSYSSGESVGGDGGGRGSESVDAAGMGSSGGSRAGAYARGREPASQDRPSLDYSFGRGSESRASITSGPSSVQAGALPASVPVQVPLGANEGQPMVVTVEGRRFRFTVPMGLSPGSVFQLDLKDATEVVRRAPPSSSSASTTNAAPAPPPPAPNEDVGADAVAGWLMERGVDPGVAIDACAALVASGLDRASRLGSAEPASLRLAGLSEEAVLAVLGDSSDVRASLASLTQAHDSRRDHNNDGRGYAEQRQGAAFGDPPEYQGLGSRSFCSVTSNVGPAADGGVNYSTTAGDAYPELGSEEATNHGQYVTKHPSRHL